MYFKKNFIEVFLVSLIFFTLPFENTILQASPLGFYGASLSIIPILLLIIYTLFINNLNKTYFYILVYACLIFIGSFFLFSEYNYEVVFYQALKNLILHLTWFFIFFYFYSCKYFSDRNIRNLFFLIIFIVLLSIFFRDFVDNFKLLNFEEIRNSKYRGFTTEGSAFGFLVTSSILLYGASKNLNIYLFLFLIMSVLLLIQSKGALVCFFISYFISLMMFSKRNLVKVFVLSCLMFLFLFFVVGFVSNLFLSDIDEYTSLATRLTLITLGIKSIFFYPSGLGFSGYYPYFYNNGYDAISFVSESFPFALDFSEVKSYFVKNVTQNVSTKSFLFDSIIVYGVPFVIIFFKFIISGLKFSIIDRASLYRTILILFLVLALTFYIPGYGSYISAVTLGIVLNKNIYFKGERHV